MKYSIILSLISFFAINSISAQVPTNQDCDGAIPVCQNVFAQNTAYTGTGNIPGEINSGPSCLGSGEKNDVWYTFTTQTAGNVCFSITPNNTSDDYDWAVYDLSANNCSDIFSNAGLEVSCNYSGTSGVTGPNGNAGSQNEPCIPVNAGETYVVNVSQFSSSTAGYTLDFGASSATIFDNIPPSLQSVVIPTSCGQTSLTFDFSENILCSSLQSGDFTLSGPGGPYSVTNATGTNCAAGGTQENTITISFTPAITIAGVYTICLVNGSGSVEDLCGNIAPPGCLNFTVTNPITADAGLPVTTCLNASGNTVPVTIGGSPTASGGGGYTYSWSPTTNLNNAGIANPTASPSITTTYTVTVTDAGGCSATDAVTVSISNLNPPTMATTPETCLGASDGTATATPTNGSPTYSYSWSPGGQTSSPATGLSPGNYTVTVTDGNGCGATNNITVVAGTPIAAGFTPPINQCLTGNSYTFNNTGTTGVTYAWDFGNGSGTSTQENPTYTYPAAGTYTVTQTVSSGACSDVVTATVVVYPTPVPTGTTTPVLCNGDATGTATVSAPGYAAYQWDAAAGNQTTNPASNLTAGSYTVVVTDGNGCTGQVTLVVTEPTPVTATATNVAPSCASGTDGTATATGANGTASYTYSWAPGGQTTQTATGLTAGTYTATVTDNNGCITTVNTTLADPPGMVLTPAMTQANCGQPDGTATVVVTSGGSGNFSYSWDSSPVQNTATASNVPAGTYTVTVTDNINGCVETASITVTSTSGITATATLINDALCNGATDGQASAAPTGGTGPYTYSWNSTPVQTSSTLTAGAGTYTVVITDNNGCTGNDAVTIAEPTPVDATIPTKTDASCFASTDGTATAAGSGGTIAYTYLWDAAASNQTTSTATGLGVGSYTVTITDANGCFDTETITILDGPLLTSTITATDVSCFGGSDGTIDFTPNGGVAPYSYNWSSGSTAEDPTGLSAGTHSVTATSTNGCVVTNSIVITEPTQLVAVIDSVKDVTCNGDINGVAYSSATGGTTLYTYLWDDPATQTTASSIGLGFGSFTVTVTDNNGCITTATANIAQPAPVAATVGSFAAYCGVAQGSVWVDPTTGVTPFTFAWDSAAVALGTNDSIYNLFPGSYNIAIEDANGCKFNTSTTVIAAPGGTAAISSFTDVSCFGGSNGTATVSTGGAFPGFTYLWDAAAGNQTTNPATGLIAGSYNVTVTDTFGCVMNTNVTINEPSSLTITMFVSDKICPNACNATSDANPGGGTAPYTYLWNDPSAQITQSVGGLCAGTYTAIITDAKGCSVTDSVTVANPPSMIVGNTTVPANCNQADGSASASVTANGIAPFTFQWSDGTSVISNTSTISNVPAGTYFVTAFDSLGCSVVDTVNILNLSGPTIAIDSIFNVRCFGGNNGYAEVQVSGGLFPYTYLWNDPTAQTTPSGSNLTAGTYTVDATDANGCLVSTAITIAEPPAIALTAGGIDPSCFGYNDGSTWVNANGGTLPYTYTWNDPTAQANDTAITLTSGTYVATVVDSNNCFDTISVVLTDPLLFSVNATGNNIQCFNACDGNAVANLTNGISPFTYAWNDPSNQTTGSIFGLCNTTTNVVVTDAMGCIANGSILLTQPNLLVLTEDTLQNVSCNGGNDGFSSVLVNGGTGPYNYSWDLSGTIVSTSQAGNNLIAGSYLVTVTDVNGCTDQITVIVTEPNPLLASATPTDAGCFGASTGNAFVSTTGGTSPYTYQWTDVALQQTDTAVNLLAGTYDVTITDTLGCIFNITGVIIGEPAQLVVNSSTVSSTCGTNNGSATVTVGGGTPSYSFAWNDPATQSTATAGSLLAGNYVIIVTDGNGCQDSTTANVVDLGSPTITIPTTTDVSCAGASDGSATSATIGGTTPYTYTWNTIPVQTTITASNLANQTYSVTVTDDNGCTASASTTIIENNALSAAITTATNVSCNGLTDGDATVTGAGGGAPYTYLWDDASSQITAGATALGAGTYVVTISDTNACTATDTIVITEPNILTLTLDSISHVKCNANNDGYLNVNTAGGTLGYGYVWTPNVSSGPTASGLVAGNYIVEVTDNHGCTATYNNTITEPAQLVVDTSTTPSTCGQANGTASVTITTASTPNYTYAWNDPSNQTTATATNLNGSLYTVTVTDANGCFVTMSPSVLNQAGPVIDSLIVTDVSCNGGSDGTAKLYTSGNSPFTYSWDDPFAQTNQTATGLSASPPLYTVTVTDGNGCSSTSIAQINEPAVLNVFINAPDTICYGESIQLFANGNGGTLPYNYLWGGGQNGQGPITETPMVSTTYSVNILDGSPSGCQSSITKTVIVRTPLSISSADAIICQGDIAQLTANASGGNTFNTYDYFWMEIDSVLGTLSPTGVVNPVNPVQLSPGATTDYIVWVEDGCSVNDTVGVTINVNDTAIAQIFPVLDACLGVAQDFVLTTDIGVTFDWDFNSDGIVDQSTIDTLIPYTYPSSGTYDVTVMIETALGCPSTIIAIGLATVHPNPIADFTTDPNPPIVTLLNPIFEFNDLSIGATSWLWSFGDSTLSNITNPIHTYSDTGLYIVTLNVTSAYGCTDVISKTVKVKPDFFFAIPNTFTPEGDGLNDIFKPGSLVGAAERDYNFFVFDRWGEIIYEGHDLSDGWDGTVMGRGEIVQTGTYVWKINVTDTEGKAHNYTGHVNVIK